MSSEVTRNGTKNGTRNGTGVVALRVSLDRISPEPLSRQVVRQITRRVERGSLRAGDILPGERTLARELGVSRVVVQ